MSKLFTDLRFRVEAALLRGTMVLFRLIPVDVASRVMSFFWKTIAPFTHRHRRALDHLAKAIPELSKAERETIIRGMWANLGAVAAETFHIDRLMTDDARFEPIADDKTQEILESGQACLLVGLHSANWELCVQPAMRRGLVITGVYQALRNKAADDMLKDLRLNLYKGGLFSKGYETGRRLVRAIHNGGAVGIMGDLRDVRGLEVNFFGQPAFATPVPATLARTYGLPIILGRTIRQNGANFKVEGKVITVPKTDNKRADITAATQMIHDVFEMWIREHPDQWMWIHRKWARPKSSALRRNQIRKAAANKAADEQ